MTWLNIAKIIDATEAEGPGLRTAIWTQGCLKRCSGCCNAEFLKIKPATIQTIEEIIERIEYNRTNYNIEGITLLGGEPGIGKSTLLLQIALKLPYKTLYVSGEESQKQIKMRAERITPNGDNCYILTETKTQIDENTLIDIAQLTGGKYFRATSNTSLQNVYDEINQLEKSEVKTSKLYNYEEYFRILLWVALGFLLLDALLRWVIFKILN